MLSPSEGKMMARCAVAARCWWAVGGALAVAAVLAGLATSTESPASSTAAASPTSQEARLRRPVALALAESDRRLLVANRCGSVSVIDTGSLQVVAEIVLGRRLSDLVLLRDGRHALATDEEAHKLLLLRWSDAPPSLRVVARLDVSPYPVTVRVDADGRRCYVASLWSRRLTIVDLATAVAASDASDETVPTLRTARVIDLPFAPRLQLQVRDDRLLVADSFGGRLAVVDTAQHRVLHIRKLPAHNIRGLALSTDGKRLLVAHQILNDLAETSHNDVHWGILLSNVLRWVVLERVLEPQGHILQDSHLHLAGDSDVAGGDPAGVAVTPQGLAVVALAGVDELALGTQRDYTLQRLPLGRCPTALVISADGRRAYVANTLDDSLSVVDLQQRTVLCHVALGPQPELSLAQRGEQLFYDARLSLDGWFSCHSCHTDGHTNGHRNDNLGDNSFGAPKRVLSLLGVADTPPWAWTGYVHDLRVQAEKSITSTLRGPRPPHEVVAALAAYMETLPPPPSVDSLRMSTADPAVRAAWQQAVQRGRAVFQQQGCGTCHEPPTYTSRDNYDVDLADELGTRHFNPPSLRGISQREAFFHDNRASTLEEVFTRYKHQLSSELSPDQLRDLVTFLRSL
jgi:YVTN family beta-propeller protein